MKLKKALSSLLVLVLLLSCMSITALAEERTPLSGSLARKTLTTGSYYLSGDATGNITIARGATVTLDLNGYVLTGVMDYYIRDQSDPATLSQRSSTVSSSVIYVLGESSTGAGDGGQLILIDSNPEAVHKFTVDSGTGLWVRNEESGTVTVKGGVITGGTGTYYGSATFINNKYESFGGGVLNSGTFTMMGGNIIGNRTLASNSNAYYTYGGGVYNTGTFKMTGGSIAGNMTPNTGAGVSSSGTFNMTGGSITGNFAKSCAGGVYSNGTFTMENGSITENTATNSGGGVYNAGTFNMKNGSITENTATNSGGVQNDSTFTMENGSITENTVTKSGGGVYNYAGTFKMTGGSITGNTAQTNGGGVYNKAAMYAGGNAIINNNTLTGGSNADNLYLTTGKTVTLGTKTGDTESTKGNGAGIPVSGMNIGVTLQDGTGSFAIMGKEDYKKFFFSDSASYAVLYNNNGTTQTTDDDFLELDNLVTSSISNGTIEADQSINNGYVSVDGSASTGDIVTITISPAVGYVLESLTIKKADSGEDVTIAVNYNSENGTFTMPAYAVSVTAKFLEIIGEADLNLEDSTANSTTIDQRYTKVEASSTVYNNKIKVEWSSSTMNIKVLSLLLAVLMMASISVTAFADEPEDFTGDSMSSGNDFYYTVTKEDVYTDVSGVKLSWSVPVVKYTETDTLTWNTTDLKWVQTTPTSTEDNEVSFTLTNRGSYAVIASASFALEDSLKKTGEETKDAASVTFTGNNPTLNSIVDDTTKAKKNDGTETNDADYLTANCSATIKGTVSIDNAAKLTVGTGKLGTYTVSISKPTEE